MSNANLYSVAGGTASTGTFASNPVQATRIPAASDIKGAFGNFPIGQLWINTAGNTVYILTGISASAGELSANWELLTSTSSEVNSLDGNFGSATPVAGAINVVGGPGITTSGAADTLTISLDGGGLAIDSFVPDAGTNPVVPNSSGVVTMSGTANQITTTGGLNSLTFSIPSAFTAPGSITSTTSITSGTTVVSTTTMTAGTGLTATTGNIVATAGAVNAGTTMTAGTGITATTGNIVATAGAVNAGTSMTATLGNITATNGNLVLGTAGNKLSITSGANASVGQTLLVNGTVTVANTAVTTNSLIQLTRAGIGTTGANDLGMLTVGTIVNGVSFVINSLSVTDATAIQADDQSSVNWIIIN